MNIETGEIKQWDDIRKLPTEELKKWIPVERDLTAQEKFMRQIQLYSPCGCGSGKKFKFCCHNNQIATENQQPSTRP